MRIAMATGWPPGMVREFTMAELSSISDVLKERARAMRSR